MDLPARYWPAFPLPDRVVLGESHNGVNEAVRVVLNTVSGLVAHDTRCNHSGEMVWIGLTNSPSYDTWLAAYLARTGVPCEKRVLSTWDLVDRYREQGIVKGYILYRREPGDRPLYEGTPSDTSVNVATSLCAVWGGVAVEESIEADAKAHGLPLLLDARGKDEAWLFETYSGRLSRSVLGRQDPKR
ncbi:MAG TPA: GxGYxYP family putative glycoside hydrolase, partial [Candidatus Hydrogenedentes bacterium]|nr:GxGYxYP family putative glycoside hydrolase [Candidatus Hydrogenedentota bacterium]